MRSFLEERGVRVPSRAGWVKVRCFRTDAHPRGDRNPSASVNLTTGRYHCFACDASGDVYDLYMQETGVDFKVARTTLGSEALRTAPREEETWL